MTASGNAYPADGSLPVDVADVVEIPLLSVSNVSGFAIGSDGLANEDEVLSEATVVYAIAIENDLASTGGYLSESGAINLELIFASENQKGLFSPSYLAESELTVGSQTVVGTGSVYSATDGSLSTSGIAVPLSNGEKTEVKVTYRFSGDLSAFYNPLPKFTLTAGALHQ